MTRPSRGERWSATTTRQTGFFLPPTRVSLTRTAKVSDHLSERTIRARRMRSRACASAYVSARRPSAAATADASAAAGELPERRHLALLELAHHLLHLAELLHELVHGLHVRARPEG